MTTTDSPPWADEHYHELTSSDREELNAFVDRLGDFGYFTPGVARYIKYRRKGYSRQDALRYALAWCRNAVEQYERRLSHETGAEGWRAI
jgi:hypothetical protein